VITRVHDHHTRRALVITLAAGERVDLVCRGRGCPTRSSHYPAGARRQLRLTGITGSVSLTLTVDAHNGARTRIRIRIPARGQVQRTQACRLGSDAHWHSC
jgi:hypothetical protein